MVQVRAAWPALRSIFRFPAWNAACCICWKCTATLHTFRLCGSSAPWRQPGQRLTSEDWLQNCRDSGVFPALFTLPWFSTDHICIDWLHVVDLGVFGDMHGRSWMDMFVEQEGATLVAKCAARWANICEWYNIFKYPARLDDLTIDMFRPAANKPPKLRAKGGNSRYLLTIRFELTSHWRSPHTDYGDARTEHIFTVGLVVKTCMSCN